MRQFETYFFDFDGTLVDSYNSLVMVFEGAYSSVNTKVPEGYTLRLMRCPLFVGYEELNAPKDEESKQTFANEIIRLLDDPEVLKATKPYEETIKVLSTLKKQGKRLGIVTSNSQKHVKEVLHFLNIDENLFSIIVGNRETKKHKPNPDPIYKGMELLGLTDKSKICYVGDALDDCLSAVNAGVTPVLIDRRHEYRDEYEIIIKDLNGLL